MSSRRLLLHALLALSFVQPALAGINVWTPIGPWGGTIGAVAVHPTDPRIVYVATGTGVYKSSDGGARWRVTSPSFDGMRSATDVVVAPSSPSTLYALSNGRIYRSTDGGGTWQRRSFADFYIYAADGLAVDPRDPAVLWSGSLGAERGIFKSVDGGATFHNAYGFQSTIESIAFAPWNADTMFVGIAGSFPEPPGILRSTDGGVTWQRADSGLALPGDDFYKIRIAPAPDAPGTVYAATEAYNSFVEPTVFRSRDGGDTWVQSGPGFPVAAGRNGAVYSGSGARSLDFGETWSTPSRPKGQVLELGVDPLTPGTAWAATSFRGLFKTTNAGASWLASHRGIAAAQMGSLAIDPVHPSVLYAGLIGGGLFKTTQGGTLWQELDPGLPDSDLFSSYPALAVDPLNPDRVYTVPDDGSKILGSRDGGITWQDLGRPGGFSTRTSGLTPDPGATGVLYAPGNAEAGCKNFKTFDRGATWTCLSLGSSSRIIVDPRNPANVYALTPVTSLVARSVDRGRTWTRARRGVPSFTPVRSIAVSPSSPNVLYLGVSNGLYKSTDRALTWQSSSVGLPPYQNVVALAVDPRTPSIAWAAVESSGVYRTTDGGAHWRPLNAGLPLSVADQLVLDPADPTTAYVGVAYYGGVYKITVR